MLPALLVPSVRPVAKLSGNALGFQGQTAQLTLRQYLIGGGYSDAGTGVSWASSNPGVASVNGSGLVTINASSGTATITALVGGRLFSTPAGPLVSAYNALGSAALGTGRTLQVGWFGGVQQTGSGFATQLLNVVNPGDGNHLRPSPGNSGATVNGSNQIVSKGLYCPGTAPYFASLPYRSDPTTIAALAHVVPSALFTDRGAGFSVTTIAKVRIGTYSWRWGNGVSNTVTFGGDTLNAANFYALKDTAANFGGPLSLGQGSSLVVAETMMVHMTDAANYAALGGVGDGNFQWHRWSRDLVQDFGTAQILGDYYANGRDFYVLDNNGFDPDGDTALVGILIGAGRSNGAQTKLLNDWAQARYGTYQDTRDLGWIFGDSEQEPMRGVDANDGRDYIAHIVSGYKGRPAISNFALCLMARAGNTPYSFQAPMLRWLEDCDFSNRAHLSFVGSEYNNGGTPADNYAWAADARAVLGSKAKFVGFDATYDTDVTKAANEPGYYNELVANAVPAHFDYLVHVHDGMEYDAYNFGDGTTSPTTGPNAVWWASRHPLAPDTQEYREGPFYAMCMLGLGRSASLANQSMKVDPSAVHKDFVYADPTFTPTWTSKRWDTVVLAGKTYAFSSRNTAIASVNASTGVITPGASNGQTGVDCWSNDGAKGTIVINLSGAPVLLHNFAVDSASSVPSADTGQATIVYNDGVWATAGGQLKRATPGVGAAHDAVGWNAGQATGTYTSKLAVIGQQMGIWWRGASAGELFFMLLDTGGNTLGVYRRTSSSDTQIDHGIVHTWANNDIVGVGLSGNVHSILINGSVVDTITDATNNTATQFGSIYIGGGTPGRWEYVQLV